MRAPETTAVNGAFDRPLLLIVDDEPVNLHMLSAGLGPDFRTCTAEDGQSALAAADRDVPDLILLDVMMPGIDGYEVCRQLKERDKTRDIPVIFVTSMTDEGAEMRGLGLGAVDFIAKPVNLRITRARILTHIQLKRTREQLARISQEDALTGIANRRRFDEVLAKEWRRGLRARAPLAVVMIDVDHFKQYNDCYGHGAGDACLQRVAQTIARSVHRPSDLPARYGGEEFVVLLADTTLEGALRVAEDLRLGIDRLAIEHLASPHGHVTVSCGIGVVVPLPHASSADLVSAADRNLYLAKSKGRNRVAA
ncbi:MAG: diguanylate cyclase [Betaproteobacteria bacterium]